MGPIPDIHRSTLINTSIVKHDNAPKMMDMLNNVPKMMEMLKNIDKAEVYKEIRTLGKHIMDRNSGDWQLRKVKLRNILSNTKGSEGVNKSLIEVRSQAEKINNLTKVGSLRKFFIGESKIIAKALVKYEDIENTVQNILTGMGAATTMLDTDSEELSDMSSWIKDQIHDINDLGKIMKDTIEALENSKDIPLDEDKKERLRSFLYTRCQDLAIISSAYEQFNITIIQTITNNDREVETANRMKIIIGTVAETGLVIRAAMNRQDQVNKLNNDAKVFASDLIKQNALNFKTQTEASIKSYDDVTGIMTSLKDAYNTISESLSKEADINKVSAEVAIKNLKELDTLHEALSKEISLKEISKRLLSGSPDTGPK